MDITSKTDKELGGFFDWLADTGDLFSLTAAFEVGIKFVDLHPSLASHLERIVSIIRNEDPKAKDSRLALTAGLFIFVDGELSRIGIFRKHPPFYRRLAAIAQTALIEREMIKLGIPITAPKEWASKGRGQHFYIQTLADLRCEPRWLPDLMNAEQLKLELLGRIQMASEKAEAKIPSGPLREICSEHGGLRDELIMPFAALPGPLEGGLTSSQSLPQELHDDLQKPIDDGALDANFFAGVVNFALVFDLGPEVAARIADVLQHVKHRLGLGKDTHLTFTILAGLASVAAVTRTPKLAKEVRVLTRVFKRIDGIKIDADNQMRIALIACASMESLNDWCEAVSDWLLEIAYDEMDQESAFGLRLHTRRLCQCIPQLWVHCGKVDAALESVDRRLS